MANDDEAVTAGGWRVWDATKAREYAANLSRDVARKFKGRSHELEVAPIGRLVAIEEAIRYFESERRAVVQEARELGVSWGDVGDALGISKQGAAKRYGR